MKLTMNRLFSIATLVSAIRQTCRGCSFHFDQGPEGRQLYDPQSNVASGAERKADLPAKLEFPKGKVETSNEIGRQSDDYDPFFDRPPGPRNTDFAVFMHLLKASIGSGILFLPYAFKRTGYVSAVVCSIVIGLISCHTAVITVQCAQILCKRIRRPMLNFAETAGASFHVGPKWIRKFASSFNVTTNIFVCFVQYETTIIYALYVATSSQQVIEHFSGLSLDIRICVVIFFPVYCALSLIRDFKNLVPFSIVGATFLGFGFCATLYYLLLDLPDPGRLDTYQGIDAIPIYCSIFLFAVHNMSVLLPLENTMKNPQHMPAILTTSMIINIFFYITFGFLGYNKYVNACDTVIKNLPLDDILAQLVKIAITISVIFTYGLQYYVPITILWPMISNKIHHNNHCQMLFRLGGVTVSTLLAVAVPQMAPLLGLFAALSMTTLAFLFPALIELSTKWYDRKNPLLFYFRLIKNMVIGAVWFILLIFGVSENVRDIIKVFNSSGEVEVDTC